MDMLAKTGGIQSIARELGISESQARSGAAALLPAIAGGFEKKAEATAGGGGLGDLLGKLGGGSLLDEVVSPQPTNVNRGNDILGQIFGSKEVSRNVAQDASAQSGVDPSVLKKMLPMLAMLVGGYLSKQGGGGLGGILGGLLGGGATPRKSNPLDDILGNVLGRT